MKAFLLFLILSSGWITSASAGTIFGDTTVCENQTFRLMIQEEGTLWGSNRLILKVNAPWAETIFKETYERSVLAFGPKVELSTLPDLARSALKMHPITAQTEGEFIVLTSASLILMAITPSPEALEKTKERAQIYVTERISMAVMRFDIQNDCYHR